jgi:hypothetical protein
MPQTSLVKTNGCTLLTFSIVVGDNGRSIGKKQKRVVEMHYIIRVTWSDRGLMCTATPRQRRQTRHQSCCDHRWRVLLHHVDSNIQYTSAYPISTDAICSRNPTIRCIPTCSWSATATATSSIRLKRSQNAAPNPSAFRRDTQRSVLSGLSPYAR